MAVLTPVIISFMRYHEYLPNLWPLIWNDPFWMEMITAITESLDSDRLVETSWQTFSSTILFILTDAAVVWSLRVFVRKMEEGQEEEGEK